MDNELKKILKIAGKSCAIGFGVVAAGALIISILVVIGMLIDNLLGDIPAFLFVVSLVTSSLIFGSMLAQEF